MDTIVMELGVFALVCAMVGFVTAWAMKRRQISGPADLTTTKRLQRRLRELDRENRLQPRSTKRNRR